MSHRLFSCAATPLRFATRNCCSLASKIKLEQLGLDVNSYSVDFLALQETRLVAGSHPIKVPHTHAILYTRRNRLRSGEKTTTLLANITCY